MIGQMSLPKLSSQADYVQLDICGLDTKEALERYLKYPYRLPVLLHGDWTKKGNSENRIKERKGDYISIIHELKKHTSVIGLTIHPPFRTKVSWSDFIRYCKEIEDSTGVPVFIENRSNSKIWLSTPKEIIDCSYQHAMTIDIPQLFISCHFDPSYFIDTMKRICWNHVKELHMANVKRQGHRTFVARKLQDGEIHWNELIPFIRKVPYMTLEILGGVPTFEEQSTLLKEWIQTESSIPL